MNGRRGKVLKDRQGNECLICPDYRNHVLVASKEFVKNGDEPEVRVAFCPQHTAAMFRPSGSASMDSVKERRRTAKPGRPKPSPIANCRRAVDGRSAGRADA